MAEKLNDDFLVEHARGFFQNSVNWRYEINDRWIKDNDLYNSQFSLTEKKKSDVLLGQGRLFIPKTYSHVQRMLVDLLDTYFFDTEEIVDIVSWKNIPSETRLIVKTLLNYRLNGNPINFYEEAYEACLDALRNKIGILKIYPEIIFTEIIDYVPRIECLPYEDVFFDKRATWKNYFKHTIIHRMAKTLDYLKRRNYKNLDLIQPIINEYLDDIKAQRTKDQGSPFDFDYNVRVENLKVIYIYEVWTYLDINDDGLLESCSYLCAGDISGPNIVIRDIEENKLPYKKYGDDYNRPPIIVGNAFPESHKMYGKSIPETVEGLQKETNAIRNQRREAVALALRKPILVNKSSQIDLIALLNRKIASVIQGDDISPSSIRELDISDPTMSSYQDMLKTDQDFYETTSIPPNLLGMPASKDETATGVTAHITNANKKIAHCIRNLAFTLFLPAFKMLLRLEQTYCSDEFVRLITNRKLGWEFSNDDVPPTVYIQGDFELTVNLGVNKQTQLNRLFMIMERVNLVNQTTVQMLTSGVVKPEEAKFINMMVIFKRILPLLGEKNYEEFLIDSTQPVMQNQSRGIASQTRLPAEVNVEDRAMIQ